MSEGKQSFSLEIPFFVPLLPIWFQVNLSYDSYDIICENNRKSNKIMNYVEEKKLLSGSFEDRAVFHVILEIDR